MFGSGVEYAVAKEHVRQFAILKMHDRRLILSLIASLTGMLVAYQCAPKRSSQEEKEAKKRQADLKARRSVFQSDPVRYRHRPGLQQTLFLFSKAMPSIRSMEGLLILLLSVLLVARTFITVHMSSLTGALGKSVVSGRKQEFLRNIIIFCVAAIPGTIVNTSIKYCTEMLQVRLRNNLSQYFYGSYLTDRLFFKVAQLYGDDTMDQRLTSDIDKWAQNVAGMFSSIFRPILDTIIFSKKVADLGGAKGPLVVIGYYTGYALLAYTIMPRYGAMNAEQLKREGHLRTAHQKLLAYAEEITVEQGQQYEQRNLNRLFDLANRNAKMIAYSRTWFDVIEGMIIKYGSVVIGYVVCMLAAFSEKAEGLNAAELTSVTIRSSFLFANLAMAVGGLLRNVGVAMELGGYTKRVYRIEHALEWAETQAQQLEDEASAGNHESSIVIGDHVRFTDVPIISPDGVTLCEKLNFYVKPGMNLLIVGPNGCGKSSMFRLLGDLWPVSNGQITKPPFSQLYYVPQRPYITQRKLRDQIIYPLTTKDVQVSESELYRCLELAGLENIFSKPHMTWDTYISQTDETLSVGEKQRLAMVRLFFHKPRFAILDECSSAIDYDVEARIYQACKDLGISLITIAHRRSVWQYHNWILKFDGEGGYMFSPLVFDPDTDDIILTKVVHASDERLIGKEFRVSPASPSYPRGAGDIVSDSLATSVLTSRLSSPHPNMLHNPFDSSSFHEVPPALLEERSDGGSSIPRHAYSPPTHPKLNTGETNDTEGKPIEKMAAKKSPSRLAEKAPSVLDQFAEVRATETPIKDYVAFGSASNSKSLSPIQNAREAVASHGMTTEETRRASVRFVEPHTKDATAPTVAPSPASSTSLASLASPASPSNVTTGASALHRNGTVSNGARDTTVVDTHEPEAVTKASSAANNAGAESEANHNTDDAKHSGNPSKRQRRRRH